MKQKISYGSWNKSANVISWIIWFVFIVVFILYLVFINQSYDRTWFWITFGVFIFAWCWSFLCVPTSVHADDNYLRVNKPFRSKTYKISDIKSVEPSDGRRGRKSLNLYYGSPKNPVLITLKDGSQFVIGTSDPKEFIDHINSRKQ